MTDSDIGFLTTLLYPGNCFGLTGATNKMYRCERCDTIELKLEKDKGADGPGEGAAAGERPESASGGKETFGVTSVRV
jgi:hypothetical protein